MFLPRFAIDNRYGLSCLWAKFSSEIRTFIFQYINSRYPNDSLNYSGPRFKQPWSPEYLAYTATFFIHEPGRHDIKIILSIRLAGLYCHYKADFTVVILQKKLIKTELHTSQSLAHINKITEINQQNQLLVKKFNWKLDKWFDFGGENAWFIFKK